jgi:hypothetical protein
MKINLKKYKKWIHPEQKMDEICIGNFNEKTYNMTTWKTKRKGQVSYDFFNHEVIDCLFPVFISEDEYKNYRLDRFVKTEERKK